MTSSTSEVRPQPGAASRGVRWPFFAPSPDEAIERALDLASVTTSDVVADLGCGDGRVLAAVAHRGATAVGYEMSSSLAAEARDRTASFGKRVRVIEGNFRMVELEADVVFCYLSLAAVYRLRPQLVRLGSGTRVVSHGFPIAGWRADASEENCHLYRIPVATDVRGPTRGFPEAGVFVVRTPGSRTLTSAFVGVDQNPIVLEVSRTFRPFGRIYLGGTAVDMPTPLPIDLIVTAPALDQVCMGGVRVQGHEYRVVVLGRTGVSAARALDSDQMEKVWSLATAAVEGRSAVERLARAIG